MSPYTQSFLCHLKELSFMNVSKSFLNLLFWISITSRGGKFQNYTTNCTVLKVSFLQFKGKRDRLSQVYKDFASLLFILKKYLFIYLWLCWVFIAACGLSLAAVSGGYSSLQRAGFSLRWRHLLRGTGSRHVGSVVVACGLSTCGTWAQ